MKRLLVAGLLALLSHGSQADAALPSTPQLRGADVDALWRAVDTHYPYFEGSRDAWRRARARWRPRAMAATSPTGLAGALDGMLAELRDEHAGLKEPSAGRRLPAEADVWAAWKGRDAVIEAVRIYGKADVAGVHAGDIVARIDGVPVERVAKGDWALRRALAGPRTGGVRLAVRDARGTRDVEIEPQAVGSADPLPMVGRRIGEGRDIGYIRWKDSGDSARLAAAFDAALVELRNARALVLDLREASGPGSREATLAVLGRFATVPTAWQIRVRNGGSREVDVISPRGVPVRTPLLVLVDRWTAGEGEALAAGLSALGGRLVGTRMAGLRGELREIKLPHSEIVARFPAQRSLHANGTPRELLRPDVEVDLAAPLGGPGDPILYQALNLLRK